MIPDLEDPLEKGMAPLQYSCLENSMDRGAWWATVHGIAKSQTGLKVCTLTHNLTVTKLNSQGMKQQYNSRFSKQDFAIFVTI